MRKFILFFLVVVFLVFFLFGCKQSIVSSSCASLAPENRNDCCAEKNKGVPHGQCNGQWVWNTEKKGCYYACPGGAGIANPASVYCEEHDGTLSIVKDASDNEYGICKFNDGSECEEWEYFNGKCKPGDTKIAVPLNEEQCKGLGGKWGPVGMAGSLRCNLLTKDGGNSCVDGSQCEAGLCFAKGQGATIGECPAWKLNFGCMTLIENGKLVGVCVD